MSRDDRHKRLMERLLRTFAGEAADLVESMTRGVESLRRAEPGLDRESTLETVYRDAHSLKGAAHSVGSGEVAQIAGAMEDVFSAVRRGSRTPTDATWRALLRAVDAVAARLPDATSADDPESVGTVVAALAQDVADVATPPAPPAPADVAAAPPTAPPVAPAAPTATPEPPPVAAPAPAPPVATDTQATASAEPESNAAWPRQKPGGQDTARTDGARAEKSKTVRVPVERLDRVLRQGEGLLASVIRAGHVAALLERHGNGLAGVLRRFDEIAPLLQKHRVQRMGASGDAPQSDTDRLAAFLDELRDELRDTHREAHRQVANATEHRRELRRLVDDHLYAIRRTRVVPFDYLLGSLPGMVRRAAREAGRDVELEVRGADIESDRLLLDRLRDPLVHLVRNAVDHGIEDAATRTAAGKSAAGRVRVAVAQAPGRRVEVTIEDDGGGIDVDAVTRAAIAQGLVTAAETELMSPEQRRALIFRSQLSTRDRVTDLSGRGLGLAIVRERIEDLGGIVQVTSRRGEGTTFRIVLPAALSTFHAIGLRVGREFAAVPATAVERMDRVHRDAVRTVEGRAVVDVDGAPLSLVWLPDLLELDAPPPDGDWVSFFVAGDAGRRVAFAVDEILEVREILLKPLGPLLQRVRNVAGATILGSGRVIPVLSTSDLVAAAVGGGARSGLERAAEEVRSGQRRVLLVEDSVTSRLLLKTVLESAGYRVTTASDGLEGLETLLEHEFDLVVSDVEMPRMNGFSLTTRIRENTRLAHLPVVLITTLESDRDRQLGLEVGANAYVGKSGFDQDALVETLERLL